MNDTRRCILRLVIYAHRPRFYLKAHCCLHGRCIIRVSAHGLRRLIRLLLTRCINELYTIRERERGEGRKRERENLIRTFIPVRSLCTFCPRCRFSATFLDRLRTRIIHSYTFSFINMEYLYNTRCILPII